MIRADVPPSQLRPQVTVGFGWRQCALALAGGLAVVLTLLASHPSPQVNGLGVLPQERSILDRSGVVLESPTGRPRVSARSAARVAVGRQTYLPLKEVLATAVGPVGSRLGTSGRLCWVVFMDPASVSSNGIPPPGQVTVAAVLVDARSGRVIEGFISFRTESGFAQAGSL